jgi:hypothetical protein
MYFQQRPHGRLQRKPAVTRHVTDSRWRSSGRNLRSITGGDGGDVAYPSKVRWREADSVSHQNSPLTEKTSISPWVSEEQGRVAPRSQSSSRSKRRGLWWFRFLFAILYLLSAFAALAVNLILLLTQLSGSIPPLMIYIFSVICFSILTFPMITLSGQVGGILFFGILNTILQTTCALALTLSMAPTNSCAVSTYVLDHPMAGGLADRCRLVQADLALLWSSISFI